ncbi:hypothetical protein N7504_007687 [Penicillium tannophilum]|nr:hypothetical protein N7504_007687 [Penicillium tannophilum]
MSDNTLLTQFQIQTLLVQERYYRDTSQWEKLRQCWHPDPTQTNVKISWYNGDIDGFVSGSQAMVKGGTSALHTVTPVEIQIVGEKAFTESVGTIQVRICLDDKDYDCVSHSRFISRLNKTDQGWKLVSLIVIYDRDSLVPTMPSVSSLDFDFDFSKVRESYKCLSWVMSQKGFQIDQTLPGTDDPDSVTKLMDEGHAWLSR